MFANAAWILPAAAFMASWIISEWKAKDIPKESPNNTVRLMSVYDRLIVETAQRQQEGHSEVSLLFFLILPKFPSFDLS